MVFNGPKWSLVVLKINHKFKWMAFITKFNLVLVWSKIVQILTKKSSKWVRGNFCLFFCCLLGKAVKERKVKKSPPPKKILDSPQIFLTAI